MSVSTIVRTARIITATSVAVATTVIVSLSASAQSTGFVRNEGQFPNVGNNGFVEIGDAGQSLSDAQIISLKEPEILDFISGEIDNSSNDVDLFKISLTGKTPFSAQLYSFSPSYALLVDVQLFLFDANGLGVIANDDNSQTPGAVYPTKTLDGVSAIPKLPSTLLPAGDYFLGISGFDNDPVSTNGLIFPNEPFQAVVGPTGAGGGAPLSGWTGNSSEGAFYVIQLTGVQTVRDTQSVPESSSELGLLILGAFGIYSVLRSQQKSLSIIDNAK